MINAKAEILEAVKGKEVSLIKIVFDGDPFGSKPKRLIEGSLDTVLPMLDFVYDDGYGSQELFGFIWYTDGSWSERGEYDGSEWWVHKKRPDKNIIIETIYD